MYVCIYFSLRSFPRAPQFILVSNLHLPPKPINSDSLGVSVVVLRDAAMDSFDPSGH